MIRQEAGSFRLTMTATVPRSSYEASVVQFERPTTGAGRRGAPVIPDILANAGGVTVSYFEWTQNIQQFRWDLDTVKAELGKTMTRAYGEVRDLARRTI